MKSFLLLFFFFLILSVPNAYSGRPVSDSLVLEAAYRGDKLAIIDYLEKGIDINAYYGEKKFTLLSFSIVTGQAAITELLIQKGADIEQICDRKKPLMFAAKHNRTAVVPMLILGGAKINSINGERNSALHYAAKYGHLELVKVLCQNGAAVNLQNNDDWTALDFAIISKRAEIEDFLISLGGIIYNKSLASVLDGPYIEIVQPGQLNVFYLSHDSTEKKQDNK